jgi:hypothetical protein
LGCIQWRVMLSWKFCSRCLVTKRNNGEITPFKWQMIYHCWLMQKYMILAKVLKCLAIFNDNLGNWKKMCVGIRVQVESMVDTIVLEDTCLLGKMPKPIFYFTPSIQLWVCELHARLSKRRKMIVALGSLLASGTIIIRLPLICKYLQYYCSIHSRVFLNTIT